MHSVADLGATSRGVWTRQQALGVLSDSAVRTALRRGEWQVLWPGTYADAGQVSDAGQRAWAAVLAGGRGAVAAGRTAARLHGLVLVDDDDPATGAHERVQDDVLVPVSRPALTAGRRRLHRHGWPPYGAVRHRSGVLVTAPARTVADCARLLAPDALVCLVDDALHRGLVTAAQLVALADDRRWSPGAPALRRALALADGRAESPAETLARLLLLPALPGLVPQHRLVDRRGWTVARFDLGDPRLRLAVEADGRAHRGEVSAARDHRRDRRSAALGWRTERCTWWDLRRGQQVLVARVLAAAADQARRQAATG